MKRLVFISLVLFSATSVFANFRDLESEFSRREMAAARAKQEELFKKAIEKAGLGSQLVGEPKIKVDQDSRFISVMYILLKNDDVCSVHESSYAGDSNSYSFTCFNSRNIKTMTKRVELEQ